LTRFTTDITLAFRRLESAIDGAVLDVLEHVRVSGDRVDVEGLGIKGPSSTWTYLDVPRQRRSVPQPDRPDADRARQNDDRHLRPR
jgi:hypothetical protein